MPNNPVWEKCFSEFGAKICARINFDDSKYSVEFEVNGNKKSFDLPNLKEKHCFPSFELWILKLNACVSDVELASSKKSLKLSLEVCAGSLFCKNLFTKEISFGQLAESNILSSELMSVFPLGMAPEFISMDVDISPEQMK
jgi:hypothetical protein